MSGLRFLDFDLLFQRTAEGYRARVQASPAGQASVGFSPPFSDLELENFFLRFGISRRMRGRGDSQLAAARAFGGRLFDAAFGGEIRSCLRSSLDEAQRQEAGLRIRLHLAEAPELNDLPWEFLLHPALDRFLSLSSETPLVRYLDLPERIRPLALQPPFEVLAVISSPADYPELDVEGEWERLRGALQELQAGGLLTLRRLERPRLSSLQRWLRRETCHIFHFIGHGEFDPKSEDGLLLFCDEMGRGREVTGQELGTLLHDHRPLRLAVLNACEGARTSRSDPFAGVAQSLVRQGIPAVVAMQFEISDAAAKDFAHELYSAVVDGYPLDAALAEARKALFFAGHELEWGTPVLYMRSPDGRIFDSETSLPAAAIKGPLADAWRVSDGPATAPREVQAPAMEVGKDQPEEPSARLAARAREAVVGSKVQLPQIEPERPRQPAGIERPVSRSLPTPLKVAAGAGLMALLVLAVLLVVQRAANGRGGAARRSAGEVASAPIPERGAGVYLKASVPAGEKFTESVVEVIGGMPPQSDVPARLDQVDGFCAATDLQEGHQLMWSDFIKCR